LYIGKYTGEIAFPLLAGFPFQKFGDCRGSRESGLSFEHAVGGVGGRGEWLKSGVGIYIKDMNNRKRKSPIGKEKRKKTKQRARKI